MSTPIGRFRKLRDLNIGQLCRFPMQIVEGRRLLLMQALETTSRHMRAVSEASLCPMGLRF